MLRNYLKIALRNVQKQPGYSLINIGGLALGLACSFLILLVVQHELSYDRFHEKADRIYRLIPTGSAGDGRSSTTPAGLATELKGRFPEVRHFIRVENQRSPYVKIGDETRMVQGFAFADPAFLETFDFELLRGNPATALKDPRGVLLTESAARELFGGEDPMGRTLTLLEREDFTVTGVLRDLPSNSHLQFRLLGSFEAMPVFMGEGALENYSNWNFNTYVLLAENASARQVEAKLDDFVQEKFGDGDGGAQFRIELQPLTDIHFTTGIQYDVDTNRDIRYVYAFSAVAVFILLIACINFMNLSTARAAKRAKEVGVRKVVGADRAQLIGQFLGESVLLSVLALVLAVVLALLLLPVFSGVIGAAAELRVENLGTVVVLVAVGLLAGVAAGSYPAFYLSAFNPVRVLKGESARGRGAATLRKGLIVVQFAIGVFLIVSTLTVAGQLRYMRTQQLGFAKEQVVFFSPPPPLRESFDAFKQKLLENPRIQSVARAGSVPGRVFTNRGYNFPGQEPGVEDGQSFYSLLGDPDYLKTLELQLVDGRNFSWDVPTDTQDTYILNEAAVKALGLDNPVGQPFRAWDRPMGQIIGVVKDFHFRSLHQQIEPLVINYKPDWFGTVAVRMAPEEVSATMEFIEGQWQALAPGYAFEYRFLDDDFDRLYRVETQLAQRFALFASIALFVACLGLFGLASYSAEQRTKEIGVRKVLGASVRSIVLLLSREFTVLVLVGFLVAAPAAYLLMNRWLADFAYRIDLGLGTFAIAAAIALTIAWLTVSYQSIKAALSDPVRSLRYE